MLQKSDLIITQDESFNHKRITVEYSQTFQYRGRGPSEAILNDCRLSIWNHLYGDISEQLFKVEREVFSGSLSMNYPELLKLRKMLTDGAKAITEEGQT